MNTSDRGSMSVTEHSVARPARVRLRSAMYEKRIRPRTRGEKTAHRACRLLFAFSHNAHSQPLATAMTDTHVAQGGMACPR